MRKKVRNLDFTYGEILLLLQSALRSNGDIDEEDEEVASLTEPDKNYEMFTVCVRRVKP